MRGSDCAKTGSPPSVANMFRLQAETERILRSPSAEQLLRSNHAIQTILQSHRSAVNESLRATQAIFKNEAAAAIVRQQEQVKAALAQMNPVLPVIKEFRSQLQSIVIPVPDPETTRAIGRAAQEAAACLSDVDKVRVRNALMHWQGLNENTRRDQLALAFATVQTWRELGNTKLRSFASVLDGAFETWALGAVAQSLRRSTVLFVVALRLRARRPRFVNRAVNALRNLKWSISPHAPPLPLA